VARGGQNNVKEGFMVRFWTWRPVSQAVALRNARHASAVLAQRRREREEIEAYLATLPEQRKTLSA
jgi:hypothetical protein